MTTTPANGDRFYRILLRAYPAAFRELYRDELLADFGRDRANPRYRGRRGALRFWRHTLADLAAAAWRERRQGGAGWEPTSVRPSQRGNPMDNILQDAGAAWRALRHRPLLTVTVVLVLAIGIGAATVVFSVIDGVLLRPLPYPDAHRLVRVYEVSTPAQGSELRSVAIPTLTDWNDTATAFDGIALYGPVTFDLSAGDRAEQVQGATASASFFAVLGVAPALGRTFRPGEDLPGSAPVVILSHGFWQRAFAGDSGVIGRTIRVNREQFTVVGIMPPSFAYPSYAEMWSTLAIDHEYDARGARHMSGLARLKPGVTLSRATSDLLRVERQLGETYPDFYRDRGVQLFPLQDRIVGGVRPALLVVGGAVVLLLLIACVNVAGLLVTGAAARRREMALRTALGATRTRLLEQLLAESLILFALGGAVGAAIAAGVVRFVRSLPPDVLPLAASVELSWPVLAFALGATGLTGLAFGTLPAMQGSSVAPGAALGEGGRTSAGGRRSAFTREALVLAETALAVMLLVGCGLLVRSMHALSRVDAGFAYDNVVTFALGTPPDVAADPPGAVIFLAEVREQIGALPGVRGVGMASRLPLSGADHSNSFRLPGEAVEPGQEHSAQDRSVSPGFFAALGIPVIAGRDFTDADVAQGAPVIVINEAFAKQYFDDGPAVGRQVIPDRAGSVPREVVGVVRDTRQFGLADAPLPEFYIPHAQDPWTFMQVAIRTDGLPLAIVPQVRKVVAAADPELPLSRVLTMAQLTAEDGARRRLTATVLSAFATVAYLLAAIGLHGVVSLAVAQRTAEIGIRIALGAPPRSIARLVVGRGVLLATSGAVAGVIAALPLTRWLRDLLFGVTPNDPATFAVTGALLLAVAAVATLGPARRALRIDPVRAMRAE